MLPLLLVAPRLARTLVPSGVELVLPRALLLHALLAARGRTGGGIYELLWVGRVNPTTAILILCRGERCGFALHHLFKILIMLGSAPSEKLLH